MCVGFQLLIFKLCLRFRAYGLGFEALKSYGVRVQDDLCKDAQVPYLFRNARMTHFLQCFESASGKTRCMAVSLLVSTSVFLHLWQPKTSFKLYRLTRTLVPQEVFDPAPGCPSTFQKPPRIASRDTGSRHLATALWCSYSNRWRQSCMENWDPTVRVSGHEKIVTSIALDLCRTEHELLQKKWIRMLC